MRSEEELTRIEKRGRENEKPFLWLDEGKLKKRNLIGIWPRIYPPRDNEIIAHNILSGEVASKGFLNN